MTLLAGVSACSVDYYSGPVYVELDSESLGSDALFVRKAMDAWQKRAGLRLFEDAPASGERVLVTVSEAGCDSHAGHANYTYDANPGSMHGTIQLCQSALPTRAKDSYFAFAIMVHEFGHVLRLDHVADTGNVMCAGVPASWSIADWQIDQVRDTTHGVDAF